MSESTAPAPKAKRGRRAAQPPGRTSEVEARKFELRRTELAAVLFDLDREFWKRGMPIATARDSAPGANDRTDDEEERKLVKDVTATMFRELESRLGVFAAASARLGEDERTGLAGLLRQPEAKRRAIVAMLRLPERERSVLRVVFGLSEQECRALAELLAPTPNEARPSIVIVDPSVLEEEEG